MLRVCTQSRYISLSQPCCRTVKFPLQESSRRIISSSTTTNIRRQGATTQKWRAIFLGASVIAFSWTMIIPTKAPSTDCELEIVASVENPKVVVKIRERKLWSNIKRGFRLIRRILQLIIALSPVALLYPLEYLLEYRKENETKEDAQEAVLAALEQAKIPSGPLGWYYRLCLHCVEWSGACIIKVMQWAGSRPDMFGDTFCAIFGQLQDNTTPHAWKHTEKALREAYGDDWQKHIRLDEILGSGCIAQVYKGVVFDDRGNEQEVAVKVMHPNVEDDIDADLAIMKLVARTIEKLPFGGFRQLKWLNLPGFVDEMETMLKIQLDLRTEAQHLIRFNENFKDNYIVVFPKLVNGYQPTKNVLMETFCAGVPIMEFIRNNTADRKLLSRMCVGAIKAVCQMIFIDNFVHGDLHPGNVLVSPNMKFVLLDVGIVTEHSEEDHKLISDILASFIRKQGRRAGRLMIDDSNSRLLAAGDHALDEERFIEKIEALTIRASGKGYLMEHLGTYIAYICHAAAQHHVMLNQTFISSALAVKIQEGIALALDPSVEIWRVAIPIIMEGERRHGQVAERAKEIMGLGSFFYWFKSGKG